MEEEKRLADGHDPHSRPDENNLLLEDMDLDENMADIDSEPAIDVGSYQSKDQ